MLERDPIGAVMRATGKSRLEVLEAILARLCLHPAVMAANPKSSVAIKALKEAIELERSTHGK